MSHSHPAHVLFRVGGHSFAIASAHVNAIHDELAVQAVGDTKHWFLGLAVADGVLMPVTDLGLYLGLKKATGRTLSINPTIGLGALRVDEVLGVDDSARKNNNAQLPAALQTHKELLSYALDTATGEHWVIDIPSLLQSAKFVNVASENIGTTA